MLAGPGACSSAQGESEHRDALLLQFLYVSVVFFVSLAHTHNNIVPDWGILARKQSHKET